MTAEDEQTTEGPAEVTEEQNDENEADTYPAETVKALRKESAGYRERAKTAESRADELSKRLHIALVSAKGVLADPSDLTFDAAHLDDDDKLTADINALIKAKPHLKVRKPSGNVGQGQRGSNTAPQDFSSLFANQPV
jgi:hypothetical protein